MLSGRTGSGAHSTFGGGNDFAARCGFGAGLRRFERSRATAPGPGVETAGGPGGLGAAAGRQEHAQPAGVGHRLSRPLQEDHLLETGHGRVAGGRVRRSASAAPEEIVLDIDTTDVALHGDQEGRFFHGSYDHYCYLPLYIFSGEHLLCARLRCANIDASAGSLAEIRRIIEQIRRHWGQVHIALRGDSGFCRDELMDWCENNRVDYAFGLARNPRLRALVADALLEAQRRGSKPVCPLGSSSSSPIRPCLAPGPGRDVWWPKPNTSRVSRIRALW